MNLYIDTHLDDIVIILFEDNRIIKKEIVSGEKQNSKLIMPTIRKILDGNIPKSILVCNGPGSFTGVRLGVTIAKTLAYTLNIPIRCISTLELLSVSLKKEVAKIVGFNDKNGYYVGIYDINYNLIGNIEYLSNSEFAKYNEKYKVFTNIELDYPKIFEFAMKKEIKNHHQVNPVYIKKLDVEK